MEKNPRMTKYVRSFNIKVPPNYFEQKKVQDQCTMYTRCQLFLCRWHYLCTEQNLQNDTVWKKLIPVQKHSIKNNRNQCTTKFLLEDIICAQKNVLHRSNIPKLIHAQKKVLRMFLIGTSKNFYLKTNFNWYIPWLMLNVWCFNIMAPPEIFWWRHYPCTEKYLQKINWTNIKCMLR